MRPPGLYLAWSLFLTATASADSETFYLGTYTGKTGTQGIYADTLDSDTGKLGTVKLAAAVQKDPTFLALSPDGHFLYAALSDGVASFKIQPDGTLVTLSRQTGPNDCHVGLDQTGRQLFAASYNSGSIAGYPISADGQIGPCAASIPFHGSGPNLDRQRSAHAHSVYVDPQNRFLYACDLGSDLIWIFRLAGEGRLIPADPPSAALPPGSGPRHLTFSPDGRLVYVANEMGVSTSVFSRDPSTGELHSIGTVANLDPGWPMGTGSAEIVLHPSHPWLYVSTRQQDAITVFAVGPGRVPGEARMPIAGLLQREQIAPCPVKFPRSFAIDPTGKWLLVAGQTGNEIAVMKIDPSSGQLTPTPERASLGSPVCVLFDPKLP